MILSRRIGSISLPLMRRAAVGLMAIVVFGPFIGRGAQDRSDVQIKEVRQVRASSTSALRRVTVALDFPGLSIYIDGFGQVPSKATLSYLTDNPKLTIRTTSNAPSLVERDLSPTDVSMGRDLDQISRDDFKYFGGTGTAPTTPHFRAAQAEVLSKHFLFPPYVYTHNSSTYAETLYHRLTVEERNLIVEVAAQLSFPAATAEPGFELKYAVRERRKGIEAWQSEVTSNAADAAKSFIVDLREELIKNQ